MLVICIKARSCEDKDNCLGAQPHEYCAVCDIPCVPDGKAYCVPIDEEETLDEPTN